MEAGGKMQKDLKEKVAIVTGAGSGIGRAIAQVFGKENAKVVVSDYNEKNGQETAKLIKSVGGKAIFSKCDVSQLSQVRNMVKVAIKEFGRLDILVNNAGVYLPHDALGTSDQEWQKTIDVDLKGVWLCSKTAIPEMLKAGKGKIINIASIAGFVGFQNSAAYCAAKGGVVNLTREMALDYGPKKINVNAIAPGVIKTAMTKSMLVDKKMADQLLTNIPIGRFGEPEDIAYLALYLASEQSDFVTGQIFTIDGGWTAA